MDMPNELTFEIHGDEYVAAVTLVESLQGAGDWTTTGVRLTLTDGSKLTADRLRNFAWASVLEAARAQARTASRSVPFSRPSDPPAAFRVSRQGRAKRTDQDYAELAAAYLAFAPDRRRRASNEWSERFGRKPGRWRDDLAKAKRYIESYETGAVDRRGEALADLRLTAEGMQLVYGDDIFDRLAIESEAISADAWLDLMLNHQTDPTLATRRNYEMSRVERWARKNGVSIKEALDALAKQQEAKSRDYY